MKYQPSNSKSSSDVSHCGSTCSKSTTIKKIFKINYNKFNYNIYLKFIYIYIYKKYIYNYFYKYLYIYKI